jgi:hypothetical protein
VVVCAFHLGRATAPCLPGWPTASVFVIILFSCVPPFISQVVTLADVENRLAVLARSQWYFQLGMIADLRDKIGRFVILGATTPEHLAKKSTPRELAMDNSTPLAELVAMPFSSVTAAAVMEVSDGEGGPIVGQPAVPSRSHHAPEEPIVLLDEEDPAVPVSGASRVVDDDDDVCVVGDVPKALRVERPVDGRSAKWSRRVVPSSDSGSDSSSTLSSGGSLGGLGIEGPRGSSLHVLVQAVVPALPCAGDDMEEVGPTGSPAESSLVQPGKLLRPAMVEGRASASPVIILEDESATDTDADHPVKRKPRPSAGGGPSSRQARADAKKRGAAAKDGGGKKAKVEKQYGSLDRFRFSSGEGAVAGAGARSGGRDGTGGGSSAVVVGSASEHASQYKTIPRRSPKAD